MQPFAELSDVMGFAITMDRQDRTHEGLKVGNHVSLQPATGFQVRVMAEHGTRMYRRCPCQLGRIVNASA